MARVGRRRPLFPMRAVVLDVDGVLANFTKAFTSIANGRCGTPVATSSGSRTGSYNFGIPERDLEDVWSTIKGIENFWQWVPPEDLSAKDLIGLHLLYNRRRAIFVTSRTKTAGKSVKQQTEEWLEQHFGLNDPLVIVAKDKSWVPQLFYVSAVLEDDPYRCMEYVNGRAYWVHILDRPYNRNFSDPKVTRVSSIWEFADRCFNVPIMYRRWYMHSTRIKAMQELSDSQIVQLLTKLKLPPQEGMKLGKELQRARKRTGPRGNIAKGPDGEYRLPGADPD